MHNNVIYNTLCTAVLVFNVAQRKEPSLYRSVLTDIAHLKPQKSEEVMLPAIIILVVVVVVIIIIKLHGLNARWC